MTAQPKAISFDVSTPFIVNAIALIDCTDYEKYVVGAGHRWFAIRTGRSSKTVYVATSIKNKHIRLHRLLLDVNDPKILVDHINGNGLDNRRKNLRICTMRENLCNRGKNLNNTTGYKGVYRRKKNSKGHKLSKLARKKWSAAIGVRGKSIKLGNFETAREATIAYKKAAKKYHGVFAFGGNKGERTHE